MKPKNLKEFKALKKRYETITLVEVKEKFKGNYWNIVAQLLTGYGSDLSCTLCLPLRRNRWTHCNKCVYSTDKRIRYECLRGINRKTFNRMDNANTPLKLLNAFRARAKHMKTLI